MHGGIKLLKLSVWYANSLFLRPTDQDNFIAARLQKEQQNKTRAPPILSTKISVIIPCYNEAEAVSETLASINMVGTTLARHDGDKHGNNIWCKHPVEVEVIISDGGSQDHGRTQRISEQYSNTTYIYGGTTRAQCMNKGAQLSSGSVLIFLHADSQLPVDWSAHVLQSVHNPATIIGCFEFQPMSVALQNSLSLRFIRWLTNIRSRYFNLPYGDQALFLRRTAFEALGGFPDFPFMEDYELVDYARRLGGGPFAVDTLDVSVKTSARRWEKFGVLRNSLLNQIIITGRQFGVPHDTLVRW